jgi:aldehyde dehydrogenase (NAD+)
MTLQLQRSLDIPQLIAQQRRFFQTGQTQPLAFRIQQLQRLKQAVLDFQDQILEI